MKQIFIELGPDAFYLTLTRIRASIKLNHKHYRQEVINNGFGTRYKSSWFGRVLCEEHHDLQGKTYAVSCGQFVFTLEE